MTSSYEKGLEEQNGQLQWKLEQSELEVERLKRLLRKEKIENKKLKEKINRPLKVVRIGEFSYGK